MTPCSGAFIIARTDVAKEAADVILVDDEPGTLIPAVEEGKTIFYNVRSFLAFRRRPSSRSSRSARSVARRRR
jgi:hypothetical protein